MIAPPVTTDPAYWRQVAEKSRRLHRRHIVLARTARRYGWSAEAARLIELAAIDRRRFAIAIETERRLTSRRTAFAGEVSP